MQTERGKKNAFEHLELPAGHQKFVERLIKAHLDAQKNPDKAANPLLHSLDPVKGKGNGLIILLHGDPGVGKTSTAEAAAQRYDLPLYPITCGNLGDKPDAVEDQLQHIFQEAHRWNCVLLLDEADIFLTKRSQTELERNALVSVFLRQLEYYGGILFLTTHRVGVLDDAFRSRIRLSLYYPHLNTKQTKKIFTKHLRVVRERMEGEGGKVDESDILIFQHEQFSKLQRKCEKQNRPFEGWWNGRQIRNAFQTVVALASFDENGHRIRPFHLKVEDFYRVARTSDEFDKYMAETNAGRTQAQRAEEQGERIIKEAAKKARQPKNRRDAPRSKHSHHTQSNLNSESNEDVEKDLLGEDEYGN